MEAVITDAVRAQKGGNMGTITIDATAMANMVENALAFSAEKAGFADGDDARKAIRGGECVVCGYAAYALSKEIGEYLGGLDTTVEGVYTYEPEYSAGAVHLDGAGPAIDRGINLIVSVDRKNAALTSIVASLEDAVREAVKPLACSKVNGSCYALDVRVADAEEVTSRRGYGALLSSLYAPALRLWARGDQS
jgi:hypothetical protein